MQRIRSELHVAGLSVWTDEGIEPGTPSWRKTIENAIKNADCLIVIFSPGACQSYWVQAELDYAWTQHKAIFPILARGNESESIPMGFAGYQYTDIRDDLLAESNLQHLIAILKRKLVSNVTSDYPIYNDRNIMNVSQAAKYLSEKYNQDIKQYKVTRWVQKGHFETVILPGSTRYVIYLDSLYLPPPKKKRNI